MVSIVWQCLCSLFFTVLVPSIVDKSDIEAVQLLNPYMPSNDTLIPWAIQKNNTEVIDYLTRTFPRSSLVAAVESNSASLVDVLLKRYEYIYISGELYLTAMKNNNRHMLEALVSECPKKSWVVCEMSRLFLRHMPLQAPVVLERSIDLSNVTAYGFLLVDAVLNDDIKTADFLLDVGTFIEPNLLVTVYHRGNVDMIRLFMRYGATFSLYHVIYERVQEVALIAALIPVFIIMLVVTIFLHAFLFLSPLLLVGVHCRCPVWWMKHVLNIPQILRAENGILLRTASALGRLDIVKLLLDRGADINVENNAALSLSLEKGHCEVAELLLDRGANWFAIRACIAIPMIRKQGILKRYNHVPLQELQTIVYRRATRILFLHVRCWMCRPRGILWVRGMRDSMMMESILLRRLFDERLDIQDKATSGYILLTARYYHEVMRLISK